MHHLEAVFPNKESVVREELFDWLLSGKQMKTVMGIKLARLTDWLQLGIVFAPTKKLSIWRREIVLKFQYSSSTQILQRHQLLILPLL